MSPLLAQMALRVEHDIFLIRQRGREVAAAVGLDNQDQIRFATALSEVGRQVLALGDGADVTFHAEPTTLWVHLVTRRQISEADLLAGPAAAAHRLVDALRVDVTDVTMVRMSRHLPTTAERLTTERVDQLRLDLARLLPGSPLDELMSQNSQLVEALDKVRAQRDELARLNEELAETNRGVLALYNQLSEELEETNRGVVALYAELDEKTAQLRAASESKSRFLANVSHELRAPVTAIIGLTRLLADSPAAPLVADQTTQVDLIRGSATDLLALVNDLLDLAKAEAGRLEPQWADVELRVVFGQLRGTLRAVTNNPDVELVVDDPVPPLVIHTDEVLLAQVLRNLLVNALKFTAAGQVAMRARSGPDGLVELVVADTGVGIPADQQERIFEEFYQVPGTIAAPRTGTGLGLPYARRLVNLLGGTLRVDSEPGRGSVFTITLPERPVG
ncbi:ATP-binding protein [Phytohabitans houttuyneae]|uniref:histidine kinase n=1 Tax=Phytohabitans houttuyneae TaxID=1076126 RepID=A0A6V8KNP3_9ACTN|nr:ATP-binding protein [Phytohabitans houttuyneae]GFJ83506.1 hypothetical protein Phou_076860 [Phytohabitans houttuyneae]